MEKKWLNHYNNSHKILLVGEGDFSFSASLARAFRSAKNMISTSFDSEERLRTKHWSSEAHLEELRGFGCRILHDVDVYNMDNHRVLRTMKFDRILFNFPHAGHYPNLCERHTSLIKMHRKLVSDFFRSARKMLNKDGEVHLTHRNDFPYSLWKIVKLAKKVGLVLLEKVEFRKTDYPGYHNKRGGDTQSNKTFPLKECYTFKFTLSGNASDESSETESDVDLCELLAPLRVY